MSKWVLFDPVTSELWHFPISPSAADSTLIDEVFTIDHVTNPKGPFQVFQGGKRGKVWTCRGDLLTKADMDALRTWPTRPYRVIIGDELGWLYQIKVMGVQSTPVLEDKENPDHRSYIFTALLYSLAIYAVA